MSNTTNGFHVLRGLRDLNRLTKVTRVPIVVWLLPAGLLIVASALEGVGIGLIAPFIEALANHGNKSALQNAPVVERLLVFFPNFSVAKIVLVLLGLICLVVTLKNALMVICSMFVSKMSRLIEHRLRTLVYERFLSFGKEFFDQNKAGNLVDMATSQVLTAVDIYRYLQYLLSNLFLATVYFALMSYISWKLTLSAIVFLPIIYAVISILSKKVVASTEQKFKIDQEMSSYLFDSLSNIALLKTFATEEAEGTRFCEISGRSRSNLYSIWKKIIFAPLAQDIVLTYATATLVVICVFVFMRGYDGFGLGAFLTFFVALRRFATTSGQAGVNVTEISRMFVPVNRLLNVFDDEGKPFIRSGKRAYSPLQKGILFDGVSFQYRLSGGRVLENIQLEIKKGTTTAIVGPTGGGKTTLISLLLRMYDPTAGAIYIDGVEIRDFDRSSILRKVGFVDQNAAVFNASIRENIVYGHSGKVDDRLLEEVVRKACLYDFVQSLPNKYDTLVGDRGVLLSGGERQRLSIARVVLKDPDVLIFDEATSSLDSETERSIQSAIESAAVGKTVITIAHRLSTIKNAGQIAVLDKGTICERGDFDSLMKQNGMFKRYWDLILTDKTLQRT